MDQKQKGETVMGIQTSRQRGRRVLVVDDDPEVIQILSVNLAHANFDVISAQNGVEALAKASEERPDLILLDIILPDLNGLSVCRQLKESPQTSHIPVIAISARVESEDRIAGIAAGVDYYVNKPFTPAEVVALVEACFKRIEQDENADPLTGLVNRSQINNRITTLIKQNKLFAVTYVDIDYFRVFNSVYGFAQGDYTIQLLADILYEAVQLFGNPDDLVGHCDGDDFVVISTPQKARILCQTMIANFDSRIRTLYTQEDLERGYIEYEGRLGQREQCPIMSLSAAVVTNEKRTFTNHLQVSEIAAELRNYLRRFPGSNYYFDRRQNCITAQPSFVPRGVPSVQREELKTTQGVLAWVAFLTKELETPITEIKDCLDPLTGGRPADSILEEPDGLEAIRDNTGQLLHILEELEHLRDFERSPDGTALEGTDLKKTFDWVMTQVQGLAEQRGIDIDIDIEWLGDISWLMVDGRSLSQGMFYLVRNEVKSSTYGDQVKIRVSDANEAFITVEIINRHRYIPPAELATLFRGQLESLISRGRRNDLYLAKVLMHGLGGDIKVKSRKGEGSIFTVFIPKRWRSAVEQVNRLQSEAESIGKSARAQFKDIRHLLQSTIEQVPAVMEESVENLSSKVQELEVLCNRSLFLADDLGSELERQQGQLLQQAVEQFATSETILVANRVIARLAQAGYLFDLESAKRVARNALVIADEFKLSRSERQALYCAALLKDLGLVLVPQQMVEQSLAHTLEEATTLGECFNTVKKALSRLNSMAPALSITLHRYERYDGRGYPSGLKGARIPLGARILAVADAFDTVTSGSLRQRTLEPEIAVKELAADSGKRFDPEVVGVFLQAWRRKAIQVALNKSILEVRRS